MDRSAHKGPLVILLYWLAATKASSKEAHEQEKSEFKKEHTHEARKLLRDAFAAEAESRGGHYQAIVDLERAARGGSFEEPLKGP